MLPKTWRPVQDGDVCRVGSTFDGGYLLSRKALEDSTLLISMGLEADWTFEQDFINRTGMPAFCFDHTVTGAFWAEFTVKRLIRRDWSKIGRYLQYRRFFAGNSLATHIKKKIGYATGGSIDFETILESFRRQSERVMLKIDIEGAEYRILDQIVHHRSVLTAVIIEFHDIDLHRERVSRFIDELDDFDLVWTHPNNYGGVDIAGDPMVLEMTLVNRRYRTDSIVANSRDYEELSGPNDPDRTEIVLVYEPN